MEKSLCTPFCTKNALCLPALLRCGVSLYAPPGFAIPMRLRYAVPMLGVYIHIPFCRTRCPYCDFVSEAIIGKVPESYVDALCREIAAFEGPDAVASIFFGGGTPSLLHERQLDRLLHAVRKRFTLTDPEITLEANPDDVTPALISSWRGVGVNRVSLGVQSFDEETLRYLGRRHDAESARRACGDVAEQFANWNMDLMFGTPWWRQWAVTLAECVRWSPPHVAAYGLTYEPGTQFAGRVHEAVGDDTALSLYQQTETALSSYDHYEVSNYSRPGYAARHNLIYWHNEEYAGFGTGAYGYIGGVRARNLPDTRAYLNAPGQKAEALRLTEPEIRVETLIQHFRLRAGLPKDKYLRRFGRTPQQDFGPQLTQLITRGLLVEDADAFRVTAQGFYLNNEIGLALVGESPPDE